MSELSKEQVQTLQDAIIERLQEFELPAVMMPSKGLVRVAYDVISLYVRGQMTPARQEAEDKHPAAQPRKPLPDPDVARDKLADALAQGSAGSLVLAMAKVEDDDEDDNPQGATVQSVVSALKQMAMAGIMPRRVTWDNSRPTHLPNANALLKNYGVNWAELARMAELRVDKTADAPVVAKRGAFL